VSRSPLVAAALALALATATAACTQPSGADVVVVTRGDLAVAAVATGGLVAADSTDILPPHLDGLWTFKIATLAPEGSTVAAGDTVVTFDPNDLEQERANAELDLAKTRELLAKRRTEVALQRGTEAVDVLASEGQARKAALQRQLPADVIAAIDAREFQLDDELAQMALGESNANAANSQRADDAALRAMTEDVASSERSASTIEDEIARLAVTSPRAGVVVYTDAKVGSVVYRRATCLEVVGLDRMIARGTIDEVDVPRLAIDQPVTLRLDAMPDVTLHGKVASIGTSVEPHSAEDPSSVVPVSIAVDPTPAALRPGMRFRASVEIERVPGVVQVPADAVFMTADGPVAYRDTGERVDLVIGRRSSDAIEVLLGLAPGDRVSRVAPENVP
jgi:multidrug resistance efflux pump